MSFRLNGTLINDGDPIKMLGELVKTGIRLNGVLIYSASKGDSMDYIMGNWKMNPATKNEAGEIITGYNAIAKKDDKKIVVFVTPMLIDYAKQKFDPEIAVGAQDLDWHNLGAYTGQSSPALAADLGAEYCLINQYEVTQLLYGYTIENANSNDKILELMGRKANQCYEHNITPVICVGENLLQREAGTGFDVIQKQIKSITKAMDSTSSTIYSSWVSNAEHIFVYEPMWAIGTGKICSPEAANEMAFYIRQVLSSEFGDEFASKARICYGGAVNKSNYAEINGERDIDGILGGGVSLKYADFKTIYDGWTA